MPQSRKGLVLTLGNAPNTPHFIPGFPGFYRPKDPTPVGGEGEVSLEQAKDADKGPHPLKLVDIDAGDVKQAEERAKKDRNDAIKGIARASREVAAPQEQEHIESAQSALKGAK